MDAEEKDVKQETTEQAEQEEQIDWNKVDPKDIPHNVVQGTMAFSGLLNDVQDLRLKNQTLSESIELLQSELQKKDSEEEQDPEEFVSVKKLNTILEQRENRARKSKEQEQTLNKVNDDNESVKRLRMEYSVEKAPKGLDADTVLREGGFWLAQNKPHLFEAARRGPDAASEIYRLSMAYCPSIRKRAKLAENNEFLDTIKSGKVTRGSAGSIESVEQSNELLKLISSNEDDILAAIEKEELG